MPVRPLLWVVGVLCLTIVFAPAFAADNQPSDPLVRVLQSKGILTQAEADSIATVSPADQRTRLAQILLDKGLISASDYQAVSAAAPSFYLSGGNGGANYQPADMTSSDPGWDPGQAAASSAPKAPPVIPAVAPVRVLQLEPAKPGGLVPDIKLGSGAKMKIYGFMKSSVTYDTAQQTGNDAPLPGFSGDTGPNGSPEFHLKARASRIGANFEWPDIREGTSITARLEADWEGNFTRAFNRNIGSIRSNQFNLRSAWARIDHMFSDQTSAFALFGQDWTPFGSSILPNSLETTLLGVGFGSMYTRDMQVRVGFLHSFAGTSVKIGPEFAIVMPGFGDTPPFLGTQTLNAVAVNMGPNPCIAANGSTVAAPCIPLGTVTTPAGNLGDQLAYAERQGADSARPEVQGRLVLQWQLDHAKGVAPAQLIFSAMQGARTVIVTAAAVPGCTAPTTTLYAGTTTPLCNNPAGLARNMFKDLFPQGATVDTSRNGWTGGFQLPTRYLTFSANYYRGTDLRFYFAGQLLKEFNNTTMPGITSTGGVAQPGCPSTYNCGFSIDGASTIAFATIAPPAGSNATFQFTACNGTFTAGCAFAVPQNVIRSQGGFAEIGIPLSRLAHADPLGRNAGWTMNLHFGEDSVFANDVHKLANSNPIMSSWSFGNLQYKLNQYVTFGYELGYYYTRNLTTGLFAGQQHHVYHDTHSEFATIFTF